MFQLLLESGARTAQRRTRWTFASTVVHAVLIGSAILVSAREAAQPGIERVVVEMLVYSQPRAPRQPVPATTGTSSSLAVLPEIPVISVPAVPQIDVTTPARLTASEPDAPRLSSPTGIQSHPLPSGQIYTVRLVDRTVLPLRDNPRPEYPSQLRSAGAEGDVLVRFVVDTSGRVEGKSIVIVQATHPLFGDAVRRWLERTRYAPAEVAGRPVRQLVQQQIGFALRP